MEYTLDGILDWLKKNDAVSTALRESLAGPDLKRLGDKIVAVEAERDTIKATLKTISEERDTFKLKDELASKRTKGAAAIAAHDLGKKHGHLPSTASPAFVESLVAIPEEEWKAKLDDRLALVMEALKPPVTPVQSAKKDEGAATEITEAQRHAMMRKALGA